MPGDEKSKKDLVSIGPFFVFLIYFNSEFGIVQLKYVILVLK